MWEQVRQIITEVVLTLLPFEVVFAVLAMWKAIVRRRINKYFCELEERGEAFDEHEAEKRIGFKP